MKDYKFYELSEQAGALRYEWYFDTEGELWYRRFTLANGWDVNWKKFSSKDNPLYLKLVENTPK